ncbi:MAG: alpha/beta hydrolase [Caldilineaceae bacterium]
MRLKILIEENTLEMHDDELFQFEAEGTTLPAAVAQGYVEHEGARIWYATFGAGQPVILLHGGLGHSGNWGHQVPALVDNGHRAIVIDDRRHSREMHDARPIAADYVASDVLAVMDALQLAQADLVGWSDGAVIALILARQVPARVRSVPSAWLQHGSQRR